jgi:hypothetical protein
MDAGGDQAPEETGAKRVVLHLDLRGRPAMWPVVHCSGIGGSLRVWSAISGAG